MRNFQCPRRGEVPGGVRGYNGDSGFDDLWAFDARARRASRVKREGEGHPVSDLFPLVVRGGTLYFLGGLDTSSVSAISLRALAGLVEDRNAGMAFRTAAGLPFPPLRRR